MTDQHDSVAETAGKTVGKLVDSIGQPVLIVMVLVFGGLIGAVMYLWDRQGERNRAAFVSLVELCVSNNGNKGEVGQ